MPILVIVRHGQSVWNLENRFTGEIDVDLSPLGREEAMQAGRKLKGIPFSRAFTSLLRRATDTLAIILAESGDPDLPTTRDAALNERNYGSLQGADKTEVAKKYGPVQVAVWRRSYSIRPPGGESLEDTAGRVIPYYKKEIEPLLKTGDNILIVAHGNSLRSLMMYLEDIDALGIEEVDIPTGIPREYTMTAELKITGIEYLK
jgi:2,3-bisphosphoglycerate-dependent phosphoglycerate mutase